MIIKHGTLVLPDRLEKADLRLENGTIREIAPDIPATAETVVDATGLLVVPGLVDIHTHGRYGHDVMEGTLEALEAISRGAASTGTTTLLATTCTMPVAAIRQAIHNVYVNREKVSGAAIAGVHLEGPYINPIYKGAQPEEDIQTPSIEKVRDLMGEEGAVIRKVTLAPEVPGGMETLSYLAAQGICVSLGHTAADYETALQAIAVGATGGTHVYNAMTPLKHRDPGVVGAVMNSPDVYAELILDGHLVSLPAAAILWKLKGPEKIVLITDSLEAAGLGDGTYELGGEPFTVRDGVARRDDGTLVGSVTSLLDMVRRAYQEVQIPLPQAVRAASLNPALSIGLMDRGELATGKRADLFLMNSDFQVQRVWVEGRDYDLCRR